MSAPGSHERAPRFLPEFREVPIPDILKLGSVSEFLAGAVRLRALFVMVLLQKIQGMLIILGAQKFTQSLLRIIDTGLLLFLLAIYDPETKIKYKQNMGRVPH